MQTAAYISTGFALLVLALSVLAVLACSKFAQRCQELTDDLRASRGRLIANEKSIDALHARIQSIDGKVARMKRGEPEPANSNGIDSGDDDLTAILALQGAPAASPGTRKPGE